MPKSVPGTTATCARSRMSRASSFDVANPCSLFQSPHRKTFNFNLAPESSIELTYNGELVSLGSVEISSDQFSMSAPILEALASGGVYEVSYKPCWPDLNCHSGKFAFIVAFSEDE